MNDYTVADCTGGTLLGPKQPEKLLGSFLSLVFSTAMGGQEARIGKIFRSNQIIWNTFLSTFSGSATDGSRKTSTVIFLFPFSFLFYSSKRIFLFFSFNTAIQ